MNIEPKTHDIIPMDSIELSPRELYLMIVAQREFFTLRLNMEQAARELQAIEYERRLAWLNNNREEAREKEADFVLRAQLDVELRDIDRRVEINTSTLISFQPIVPRLDAVVKWRDEIIAPLGVYAGLPALIVGLAKRLDDHAKEVSDVRARLGNFVAYGAGMLMVITILMFILKLIWR